MYGDTIDISFPNGTVERIHFLSVDTPETSASRNKPNEYDHITDLKCFASWRIKAKFFTRDVLLNKVIYIEFDPKVWKRGYYGRLLAYIYLENGIDFTALLIKKGMLGFTLRGFSQRAGIHSISEERRIKKAWTLGL